MPFTYECAAVNYNAYGLESSRTPSYVSCSFGGDRASSGSVAVLEGATVKSATVTKTETVVIKTEEKKEEEKKEQEEQQQQTATEEPAAEEKEEQEQAEAEVVAEE